MTTSSAAIVAEMRSRRRSCVGTRGLTCRARGAFTVVFRMRSADPLTPEEIGSVLAEALDGDRSAERVLTESVLLPVLDAAVTRMLLGAWGARFEKTDVIQEIFQHLYQDGWRRLRSYDAAQGSLASYLWGVASGWIRDHARRRPPPEPIEDMESQRSPESGPEGKAALGELIERLEQALSLEELALFQWIYLEGISHATAAGRLGATVEAVHKRAQRMETKVRAVVSGEK